MSGDYGLNVHSFSEEITWKSNICALNHCLFSFEKRIMKKLFCGSLTYLWGCIYIISTL